MRLPPDLFQRTPVEVVRRVVRGLVAEIRSAATRLDDPDDTEALHDFRVAVRRLRATARGWPLELAELLPREERKALKRLQHATGQGRDSEVLAEWVQAQMDDLSAAQRVGAQWLVWHFTELKVEGYSAALPLCRTWSAAHGAGLAAVLERVTINVDLSRLRPSPTYADALTAKLVELSGDLLGLLSEVCVGGDRSRAHAARIACKRLRYLLEPAKEHAPDVRAVVQRCKRLQDLLGEFHDVAVLTEALAALTNSVDAAVVLPGLDAVARRATVRSDVLLAAVVAEFGGPAARAALSAQLEALGDALGGSNLEIERKFLLRALPPEVSAGAREEIDQGWLPGAHLQERLRRVRRRRDGVETEVYLRTVKTGRGLVRTEIEEACSAELFDALWPLTGGCRVAKVRHKVAEGGLTWEIDEFVDRDLVLAEVELSSADAKSPLPAWLEVHVVREVTGEAAYVNRTLAR